MASITVTKRPGRKNYYARVEGRYLSTGQTDQRLAMQVAVRMRSIGVDAYRRGKRTLSVVLADLIEDYLNDFRDRDGRTPEHLRKKRMHLMRPIRDGAFRVLKDVKKQSFEPWLNAASQENF